MDLFSAHSVFALNMYNTYAMAQHGQNLLLSPISIFAALSMLLPGAKDNSLNEMLRAMQLTNSSRPMEEIETRLGQMLASALGDAANGSGLLSANRAYIDLAFALRPEYLRVLGDQLHAQILKAQFRGAHEAERTRINEWVAEVTKGKISDLMPPGSINANSRLVLANALYFKSEWETPFEASETSPQQFELYAGSSTTVQMMERMGSWDMIEIPDLPLTIVYMPFKKSSGLSMLAILPTEKYQLDSVMSAMKAEDWLRVLGAPTKSVIAIVRLPKVRLASAENLESPEYLPRLGMKEVFHKETANLRNMIYSDEGEQLFVSSVVHKAVFEWNEAGAEGSASTGETFESRSMVREIFFNQPFLAVVVKEVSKDAAGQQKRIPIFVGRVSKP